METKIYHTSSISEVADIFVGGAPKRSNPEYWNGNIKWLTAKDICKCNSRYVINSQEKITEKGLGDSAASLFNKDTIVITARGTVGAICMLGDSMAFNQSCYGIIAKENIIPSFLYYALKFSLNQIKNLSYGTIFDTITTRTFDLIKIPLPSLDKQKWISYTLSSIDDIIEMHQKINNTLELLCQTLFQHWFLDFEFANEEGKPYKSSGGKMVDSELGEIPKGWQVTPIGNVAKFVRGFSYKGSEKFRQPRGFVFVTLNSIREGGGFKKEYAWLESNRLKERHYINEMDLIIANTEQTKDARLLITPALVIFPFNYERNLAVFSHHITKIEPKFQNLKFYLYSVFLYKHYQIANAYHTGTGVWGFDHNSFQEQYKIILPSQNMLQKFDQLALLLHSKIIENEKNISILGIIRDSLLPKLMSGEIRI